MEYMECTLILGMFDGVHIGHRALISAALETGRPVVAYTFDTHPMVIVNGFAPPMLMTSAEKQNKLLELGAAHVMMETFDAKLAQMHEDAYIEMLFDRFAPKTIVVGYNHTFGQGAKGSPQTIRKSAKGRYETVIVPPVFYEGDPVSSTRIRRMIANGNMADAEKLLGEPYCFEGVIERNAGIGTDLGFPTANIALPDKLLPPNGVYAVRARLERDVFPGVMNIGIKPTVSEESKITLETHLIGFKGDAYGKRLKLELLHYIREERRFASMEALAEQIGRDREAALTLAR